MARSKKSKHTVAGVDGWSTQQKRGGNTQQRLDPAQQAMVDAFAQGLHQAKGFTSAGAGSDNGRSSAGGGSGPRGPQPRPIRADDPPQGGAYFKEGSTWCTVTWASKLYWINTARGGWSCTTCHMPANHSHRWYCTICGKKWTKDMPTFDPKSLADQDATPGKDEDDSESVSSGSADSAETMDAQTDGTGTDGTVAAPTKYVCAAQRFTIPNLDKQIAAQVTPSVSIAAEVTSSASTSQTAVDKAQTALDGAAALLQLAQTVESTPKTMLDGLTADVESKKKVLATAAEKLKKESAQSSTPATALLKIETAQEKLKTLKADHEKWKLASQKKKEETAEAVAEQVRGYRELAAALALDAARREESARQNADKWEEVNNVIDTRWASKIEQQEQLVQQLTVAAPTTITITTPLATPAVGTMASAVPNVTRPPMLPMVVLPEAKLPETQEEVVILAGVLTGLQQLEEQELDVRAAYPVRWHMLWEQGMTAPLLNSLIPQDLWKNTSPLDALSQRALGALRRQLDKLAAKWEVKYAEACMQAQATAAASVFHERVMEEAKRVQERKRVASETLSPDKVEINDAAEEL